MERVAEAGAIVVSVIVLGELHAGFIAGNRPERNTRELDLFLSEPRVRVAQIDRDTSQLWGRLLADLRRAGSEIPTNDLWIAATAIQHRCPILTTDRHFRTVPQLDVVFVAAQ